MEEYPAATSRCYSIPRPPCIAVDQKVYPCPTGCALRCKKLTNSPLVKGKQNIRLSRIPALILPSIRGILNGNRIPELRIPIDRKSFSGSSLRIPWACEVPLFPRSTTLQRFNAPTLQRFNAPTFQRFNASTLQRSNAPTLQRFNASTPQRSNAPTPQRSNASTFQRSNAPTLTPVSPPPAARPVWSPLRASSAPLSVANRSAGRR